MKNSTLSVFRNTAGIILCLACSRGVAASGFSYAKIVPFGSPLRWEFSITNGSDRTVPYKTAFHVDSPRVYSKYQRAGVRLAMKIGILVFSAFLAATTSRAELGFSFSFDEQVPFGNDLRWCVSVTNATETTGTVAVAFSVDWLQYNGEVLASVSEFATTNAIAPFSSTNVECRVPVSTYRSFLSASETFECSAAAWNVFDENNEDVELMRAFVEADNLPSIGIAPLPLPSPGEAATITVGWTNSTPFALSAVFSLALSAGLRTSDDGWLCTWPTNAIPPGGACVLQTNVVVSGSGPVSPTVHMMSDSYPQVENTLELAE